MAIADSEAGHSGSLGQDCISEDREERGEFMSYMGDKFKSFITQWMSEWEREVKNDSDV